MAKDTWTGTIQDVAKYKSVETSDTLRMSYRPQSHAMSFDYTFKIWPNRESMALAIRMQQKRAHKSGDWLPIIKLKDNEGY